MREIVNALRCLAVTLLLILSLASPSLARVAAIETSAPLKDQSQQSVKMAVTEAVNTAVRVAVAMGLPWLQVRNAFVLKDMVTLHFIASDIEPEEEQEGEEMPEPGSNEPPGAEAGRSQRLDL